MLLITGAGGQVGRALAHAAAARGQRVTALRRAEMDVTDPAAVEAAVSAARATIVANCAAYTSVDGAEDHPDAAHSVNALGAAHLAACCDRAGIPMIHVSTDYVFDGGARQAYREDDPVAPITVYGRTKWEGEEAVRFTLERHLIVRTSWVFSAGHRNFVTTILELARAREELRVVSDQIGSPTHAGALAESLLELAQRAGAPAEVSWGTYHVAGEPPASRYELASAAIEAARRRGEIACRRVVPVESGAFPTRAPRPANTALDCTRAQEVFGLRPIDWHSGVEELVAGTW